MDQKKMTYREAYEYGKKKLIVQGILEAELDARLLLEHVCGKDRNYLLVYGNEDISTVEENSYFEVIEKRGEHIPLQHITGIQEFMGFPFMVNESVLIPRQDTECLVEEALIEIPDGSKVLDVCTGSGCILLSLMKYKNAIEGMGVDISEEALVVARKNAESLGVHVNLTLSDMFQNVNGVFDAILSNPPYIRSDVIKDLSEEVKNHDPRLALDGKEDGLYFYRILAEEASDYLKSGGKLIMEIGYDQGKAVSELLRAHNFKDVTVIKDLAGLDRVVKGRK